VFASAPTAVSSKRRVACEASFRHAVYRNLHTVALLAAEPRGTGVSATAEQYFVRARARAAFVVEEAEATDIRFSVHDGTLEVDYPRLLPRETWHSFQFAIVLNREEIAKIILARESAVP
jgi:hypothetical protein